MKEWKFSDISRRLVMGRRDFLKVRADSFMSRELNVVVLSDLIQVLNSSSFLFIVSSSSNFSVSILVLILSLALRHP